MLFQEVRADPVSSRVPVVTCIALQDRCLAVEFILVLSETAPVAVRCLAAFGITPVCLGSWPSSISVEHADPRWYDLLLCLWRSRRVR